MNANDIQQLLDGGLTMEDVERLLSASAPRVTYNHAEGGGATIQNVEHGTAAAGDYAMVGGGGSQPMHSVVKLPAVAAPRYEPVQLPERRTTKRLPAQKVQPGSQTIIIPDDRTRAEASYIDALEYLLKG